MGQVITMPLLDQTIIFEDSSFFNAVQTPADLYKQAQRKYEEALKQVSIAQNNYAYWDSEYKDIDNYIKNIDEATLKAHWNDYATSKFTDVDKGALNPHFAFILGNEFYGDDSYNMISYADEAMRKQYYGGKTIQQIYNDGQTPKFLRWISNPNLRRGCQWTQDLTQDNWKYIYRDGVLTGTPQYRAAQWCIAKAWYQAIDRKRAEIKTNKDNAANIVSQKQKILDESIVQRDKALAAEERASGQRIKEKQTDPEYLKAKAESDKILLESEDKKRKSRNILILGLGLIAITGAYLILRKK